MERMGYTELNYLPVQTLGVHIARDKTLSPPHCRKTLRGLCLLWPPGHCESILGETGGWNMEQNGPALSPVP